VPWWVYELERTFFKIFFIKLQVLIKSYGRLKILKAFFREEASLKRVQL
jgi:hypothetical protein